MIPLNQRRIFVRDLACQAQIGVHPHEKTGTRLVYIDIDAVMDDAPHDDRLENTVCYDDLAAIARKITGGQRVHLIETLAEQIAIACLDQTPILRVSIRVRKPDALDDAKEAGVEISRKRVI